MAGGTTEIVRLSAAWLVPGGVMLGVLLQAFRVYLNDAIVTNLDVKAAALASLYGGAFAFLFFGVSLWLPLFAFTAGGLGLAVPWRRGIGDVWEPRAGKNGDPHAAASVGFAVLGTVATMALITAAAMGGAAADAILDGSTDLVGPGWVRVVVDAESSLVVVDDEPTCATLVSKSVAVVRDGVEVRVLVDPGGFDVVDALADCD